MVCYFAMLPYMIEKIMLFSYAKLAIFCMLPAILFSGFAGCIEGYLLGLNKKSPVAISYVVKGVSFLLFSIISISLLSTGIPRAFTSHDKTQASCSASESLSLGKHLSTQYSARVSSMQYWPNLRQLGIR